jgi:flagellar biosynthesis/type III secretory pathway ATPase
VKKLITVVVLTLAINFLAAAGGIGYLFQSGKLDREKAQAIKDIVFALLPEILERAGKTEIGSITGFYTVLVEGDDFNEPIPDAVKGITDGHLWLSRTLANRGHFPAIDMLQSISRVRGDVAESDHVRCARRLLSLLAVYQEIEDLVNIGAYVPGINPEFDLAVQARPRIVQFLQQEPTAPSTLEQSKKQVAELAAWVEQADKVIRTQAGKKQAVGSRQ